MATSSSGGAQQVAILTQKLYDADSDIRYMSLNDLATVFSGNNVAFLSQDVNQCSKTVDGFLNTLNDPNGEVQNLTIKCLGPFVLKANPDILSPLIHKIGSQTIDNTVDHSISATALRTIVISLPRPTPGLARTKAVQDAYHAISKSLIPRLVGRYVVANNDRSRQEPSLKSLLKNALEKGTDSDFIDILIEIAKCFGSMLQSAEIEALQQIAMQLLEGKKSGSVMKKKAVTAIAALAQYLTDQQLSSIVSYLIQSLRAPHLTPGNRKLYITLMGSLATAIPAKFGPQLKLIVPFVLSPLSQAELVDHTADSDSEEQSMEVDEVREAALTTLEAFLSACSADMERFSHESLEAILRYLKYDPNVAIDSDDETGADPNEYNVEELDLDEAEDEDFEQEDVGDDEDDFSWKVRRCAARTLRTMLAVKGAELLEPTKTFDPIAKGLLDRFKEREETVRVEVIQTTSYMVRHCAQDDAEEASGSASFAQEPAPTQPALSKKRRRAESDVSMSDHASKRRLTGSISPPDSPVPPGAPANLAKVGADLVRGGLKLASTSTPATQTVSVTLLKEFIIARRGGANEHLQELLSLITKHIDSSSNTALQITATTSHGSLQIEALQLLSEVAKATPSTSLQPLMGKGIASVIGATKSKSPQLACEALKTMEQLVKALTPPRSASTNKQSTAQVSQILETVMAIAGAKGSDLETRKHAILVIGTLVGRTLTPQGAKLINAQQRQSALDMLHECCKNETTRYATIRAIDVLGAQSPIGATFNPAWFKDITTELGNQLRKADRALRTASLAALRTLLADRQGSKNLADPNQLAALLMPLLSSNDLHMTGLCLVIYAALVRDSPSDVVSPEFIKAYCRLLVEPIAPSVVDQLSMVAESAGQRGKGAPLMKALLREVGVNGPPAVVGKLIGDLLTSSGTHPVGISLDAFLNELRTARDEPRKCLALSVIGEVGLRSGSSASVTPELFVPYFDAQSQTLPIAAAIALGRAAAGTGNVQKYLPAILSRASSTNAHQQYLTLHSIKEMLQYSEDTKAMASYKDQLWNAVVAASQSEESKTVGAECLASLALIEPKSCLDSLQVIYSSNAPKI